MSLLGSTGGKSIRVYQIGWHHAPLMIASDICRSFHLPRSLASCFPQSLLLSENLNTRIVLSCNAADPPWWLSSVKQSMKRASLLFFSVYFLFFSFCQLFPTEMFLLWCLKTEEAWSHSWNPIKINWSINYTLGINFMFTDSFFEYYWFFFQKKNLNDAFLKNNVKRFFNSYCRLLIHIKSGIVSFSKNPSSSKL